MRSLTTNAFRAFIDIDRARGVEAAESNGRVAGVPVAVGGVLAEIEAVVGFANIANRTYGGSNTGAGDVAELKRGEFIVSGLVQNISNINPTYLSSPGLRPICCQQAECREHHGPHLSAFASELRGPCFGD